MKINDLTIGDWVRLIADDSNECLQVSYVRKDGVGFNQYGHFFDEIEPIPLTEEILKVNGWNKNGAYNDYILRGDIDDFIGYNATDKHVRIILDGWNARQEVYVSANYVHELQHALRLCGLTELADNFKVE